MTCFDQMASNRDKRKSPGPTPGAQILRQEETLLGFFFFGLFLVAGALQRRAQDVAQSRARIRRPILGNRFLLFGDFKLLDRERQPLGLAIVLGDARIDLLADREALGPLVVAVARQ